MRIAPWVARLWSLPVPVPVKPTPWRTMVKRDHNGDRPVRGAETRLSWSTARQPQLCTSTRALNLNRVQATCECAQCLEEVVTSPDQLVIRRQVHPVIIATAR